MVELRSVALNGSLSLVEWVGEPVLSMRGVSKCMFAVDRSFLLEFPRPSVKGEQMFVEAVTRCYI